MESVRDNGCHTSASIELLHHQQTAGLSVRGAEPPGPVVHEASQDGAAETESAELVHHHHQAMLPGRNLSYMAAESLRATE